MRNRGNARHEAADDADLEGWISELSGGEPTVRRLRQRLDAERPTADDDACPTCAGSSSAPGHLPVIRSAS